MKIRAIHGIVIYMDMWEDIDVEQIKVFFNTLTLNASFFGMQEQLRGLYSRYE